MNNDEFRKWSQRAAEWGADYRKTLQERPVRAQCMPGDITKLIANSPPEQPEPMSAILTTLSAILSLA
jgi:aromatic-L-amino-acid decarboxylase